MKRWRIPPFLAFAALTAVSCSEGGRSPVGPEQPFETQPAFDDVPNTLDASVDAVAEVMPLVLGGPNGTTQLYVQPTNFDGKNGCNFQGTSTTLVVSASSSNTSVATMSPSTITFASCGDTPTLTITPAGLGSATISLSQVSNDTGATFNLAPATFTVTVAAPPPPSNTTPAVNAGDDATIDEGGTFTQSGSFTDPDANTWSATVDYGDGSGSQSLTLNDKNFSLSHTYADNGVYTVTVSVNDGTATGTDPVIVTVTNVVPTVTGITAPSSVNEGSTIAFSVAGISDPGTADVAAGFGYSFACDAGAFSAYGTTNSGSCAAPDGPATVTVRAKVRDKDGGESAAFSVVVTVTNVAPTATFNAPSSANEGTTFNVSLTNPQDVPADLPTLTYAFDCGSGYGSFLSATSATCSAGSTPGAKTVKGKVKDKDGGETEYTASVTINDVVPDITSVTGPALPVQLVGSSATANITVTFTGAAVDNHTIKIVCDVDGASTPITRNDAPGTFTQSCVYSATGVNSVLVTVQDEDGSGIDDSYEYRYVVVYDPTAGFVTGGGWIQSQQSFCKNVSLCPNAGGKGSFGFVSKYLKGATVPTGNTEFQLQAGDFNLKSADYQWLVVNQNGTTAQFKGTGTINGTGSYRFQIWATDGSPDKFRIRVWQESGGVENDIYDNGVELALNGTAGNGSIQIHVPKK